MNFEKESLEQFLKRGGKITRCKPGGDGVPKPTWKREWCYGRYKKVGKKILPNDAVFVKRDIP